MAEFVVLQPNGDGFHEVARVEAATPNLAIEQVAKEPGKYVAVAASRLELVEVAPVTRLSVVKA